MRRAGGLRIVLAVLFGPIVWAVHLMVVYGGYALWYAAAGGRSVPVLSLPVVVVFAAATALFVLLIILPLLWPRRLMRTSPGALSEREGGFLVALARWLAGLSLFGILATIVAVLATVGAT